MQSYVPSEYDDGVDVREYAATLWRRLPIIAGIAIAAGLAAFVTTREAPLYEAVAQLVVSGPVGDVARFAVFVQSSDVARAVVSELGLDKPPASLTADTFIKEHLRVDSVPASNTINAAVRLANPAVAARAANRTAERAVELARQMIGADSVQARTALEKRRDEAVQELEQAEARLFNYQRTGQTELLEDDSRTYQEQRRRLADLTVKVASLKAQLASTEGELKARQRIRTLTMPISRADDASTAARRGTELAESFDPVYEQLDQRLVSIKLDLAAAETETNQLQSLVQAKVSAISDLYGRRAMIAKLTAERDQLAQKATALKSAYTEFDAKAPGELRILGAAVVPSTSMPQHMVRNVVAAVIIALILSVMGVIAVKFVMHLSVDRPRVVQRSSI